jgi:CHAT domain-containing protein/tetratricopeptide (TPR) repeat protein
LKVLRKKFADLLNPRIARGLNRLGLSRIERGEYPEAVDCLEKALHLLEATENASPDGVAAILTNLGEAYRRQGRYQDAESVLERALSLFKASGDLELAEPLNNLALVRFEMGQLKSAEELLAEAVEIWRKKNGNRDPEYAKGLVNLGRVLQQEGEHGRARKLLEEAAEVLRWTGMEADWIYAVCLNNLAELHSALGNLRIAARLYAEAVVVIRGALGEKHVDFYRSLGNLGQCLVRLGDYQRAEPYLEAAGEAFRQALGGEHLDLARVLETLGMVDVETKRFEQARAALWEAFSIFERKVGKRHFSSIMNLQNLAALYGFLGQLQMAEPLQREAEALAREVLGEMHPSYAMVLTSLGALLATRGQLDEAQAIFERDASLEDQRIALISASSSEPQRAAYLAASRIRFWVYVSFILWCRRQCPASRRQAMDLVLRRKAMGAEALLIQWATLLTGRHPQLKKRLDWLLMARQWTTETMLSGPGARGSEEHWDLLARMQDSQDRMETDLVNEIPEMSLRETFLGASTAAVAAALPASSVLVEIVRMPVHDFEAVLALGGELWSAPRYLAFVLHSGMPDDVQLIDLGAAKEIDDRITAFRLWVTGSQGERELDDAGEPAELADPGSELRSLVFDPLLPALKERRRLIIAADGELNRLPLEVLPLERGGRLIDEHVFSYVSVGRDVLRFGSEPRLSPQHSLVIADPDFDLSAPGGESSPAASEDDSDRVWEELERGPRFARLAGTEAEGRRVAELLGVDPWLGREALEGRLKRWLRDHGSPRILHLATHGFFRENDEPWIPGADLTRLPLQVNENPLLRSGIALAGANTRLRRGPLPAEAEDGLLFAEDVAGLSFLDTEMVVLSACKTGLGEVADGEGVLGLRRSFALAGARTLVMSLWKVPDHETRELMEEFYLRLLQGEPRAEALRGAQLVLKSRHPHPYYWGAFICQGFPGPLEKRSGLPRRRVAARPTPRRRLQARSRHPATQRPGRHGRSLTRP